MESRAFLRRRLNRMAYLYWFNLDGVAIADPVNPIVKLRQRTSASLVEVPAQPPAGWELCDVPHGMVVTEWQASRLLHRIGRIVLYLPPGYEKSSARYPVLYLVHGSGDVPESWVNAGHVNFILDNLLAAHKARPMIVMMPAGHALPFSTLRGGPVSNNDLFEQYLTKEVIPLMETKYRTSPDPRHRALAGLSMGGGHTIYTGFHHPDLFSAPSVFSPGLPGDFDRQFQTALTDPKTLNSRVGLLWISCGDHDTTVHYERVKAWVESLDQHGIHATFHTYAGSHTWPVWHRSLTDFAPLLFAEEH